jgi:hypothetical protein
MQVGYVGLVKAINNFDPADGDSLSAYAAPCVSGEVKRYFRDKRWQVHSAPSSARHREEGDLSPLAGGAPSGGLQIWVTSVCPLTGSGCG